MVNGGMSPEPPFEDGNMKQAYQVWVEKKGFDCRKDSRLPLAFILEQIYLHPDSDRELRQAVIQYASVHTPSLGKNLYRVDVPLDILVSKFSELAINESELSDDPDACPSLAELIWAGAAFWAADFIAKGETDFIGEVMMALSKLPSDTLEFGNPPELAEVYLKHLIVQKGKACLKP